MLKLQTFLLLLPTLLCAQRPSPITRDETEKAFSRAIAEYVQVLPQHDKVQLDTLFAGKNEEFPDITLAARIQNTPILVLSSEEADKKLNYRKSLIYVNIIGDVTRDLSQFLFVTFLVVKPGKSLQYLPQHNCTLELDKHAKKEFTLVKLRFDYPYATRQSEK